MRLGPLGGLREVVSFPEVPVERERAGNSWTTMSGRRVVQRAPRSLRSWSLDYRLIDPADLAYLTALASGAVPGPHFLYTEVAARANLLPADVAAPGLNGTETLAPVSGVRVSVDMPGVSGVPMVAADRAALGFSPLVPVLPSTQYVLSCWCTGSGSALFVRFFSASGVTVGSDLHMPSGSGRRAVSFTTGASVASLRVRAQGSGAVTGLRLTQGATQDAVWVPGQGVPQVVVDDPSETLQLVTAGRIAADYSITLREVG